MDVLLIDGNDDVVAIKNVLAPGPALDRVIIDRTAALCVLGKCLKEVRVEEVHLSRRHFELIVEVSDTVSKSYVCLIVWLTRGRS
jgi:hypothetical protein